MEESPNVDVFTSLNIEYVFLKLYELLTPYGLQDIGLFLYDMWFGLNVVAAISVPILFIVVLRTIARRNEVMAAEYARYEAEHARMTSSSEVRNERWQEILDLVNSDNPSNWRLAIIEADIMLDDLLKRLGYLGDTLGERLRSIDAATFKMLDQAWEAHRVRNQIAHEGSDYILTQREARRVIELYRQVFTEHGVI